ncbi:MAG: hypothetical protein Q8K63_12480 [Acidimicrobiales bacterium]|nr:hypothetical protein [Acidimicrobiales bacterium]
MHRRIRGTDLDGSRYSSLAAPLGPALRDKFDIPWSPRQQMTFARFAAASRAATPVLVAPLRTAGPLALKLRKREIAKGPFS